MDRPFLSLPATASAQEIGAMARTAIRGARVDVPDPEDWGREAEFVQPFVDVMNLASMDRLLKASTSVSAFERADGQVEVFAIRRDGTFVEPPIIAPIVSDTDLGRAVIDGLAVAANSSISRARNG